MLCSKILSSLMLSSSVNVSAQRFCGFAVSRIWDSTYGEKSRIDKGATNQGQAKVLNRGRFTERVLKSLEPLIGQLRIWTRVHPKTHWSLQKESMQSHESASSP